jgi:hypothetical protein
MTAAERVRRHRLKHASGSGSVTKPKSSPAEPVLDPADMQKTMLRRYEAAIRKARQEIREELRQEVYRELDVFVRNAKERYERANRIIAAHKGVMSKGAFRRIKAALHPDHNKSRFAAETMQMFSDLEDVLVKPEEPIRDSGAPPLPTTAAELMARRRHR